MNTMKKLSLTLLGFLALCLCYGQDTLWTVWQPGSAWIWGNTPCPANGNCDDGDSLTIDQCFQNQCINTFSSGEIMGSVQDLKVDSLGNLWVTTPEGVRTWNGSFWRNYTTQNSILNPYFAATRYKNSDLGSSGKYWLAGGGWRSL